jgi:hypothetical protein
VPHQIVQSDLNVRSFAQQWFDLLSAHGPVEQLLPFVADRGLDMAFPERTLRSHADFLDWYLVVGRTYREQAHVIEQLTARADGDEVAVAVTVVWLAELAADRSRIAVRVDQDWRLERVEGTDRLRIRGYRVGEMHRI